MAGAVVSSQIPNLNQIDEIEEFNEEIVLTLPIQEKENINQSRPSLATKRKNDQLVSKIPKVSKKTKRITAIIEGRRQKTPLKETVSKLEMNYPEETLDQVKPTTNSAPQSATKKQDHIISFSSDEDDAQIPLKQSGLPMKLPPPPQRQPPQEQQQLEQLKQQPSSSVTLSKTIKSAQSKYDAPKLLSAKKRQNPVTQHVKKSLGNRYVGSNKTESVKNIAPLMRSVFYDDTCREDRNMDESQESEKDEENGKQDTLSESDEVEEEEDEDDKDDDDKDDDDEDDDEEDDDKEDDGDEDDDNSEYEKARKQHKKTVTLKKSNSKQY